MADFKNFDPTQYVVTFAGILMKGFMSDTFIQASRNQDAYSQVVGAFGDVTRIRASDKSGIVTVTLMAESLTNDALSARIIADELSPGGIGSGALLVKNLNGTTSVLVENAWIQKVADLEVSTDTGPREWIIACAELNMFVGGASS